MFKLTIIERISSGSQFNVEMKRHEPSDNVIEKSHAWDILMRAIQWIIEIQCSTLFLTSTLLLKVIIKVIKACHLWKNALSWKHVA